MGLNSAIRAFIYDQAKEAIHSTPADVAKYLQIVMAYAHSHGGLRAIEDALTRLVGAPGPNKDYQFTGAQLLDDFARGIGYDLMKLPVVDYICTIDDHNNVPLEKRNTQVKRSLKSKHDPYKPGSFLHPLGIIESGASAPTLIDIRRLMRSSHLRPDVWNYFRDNLNSTWIKKYMRMGSNITLEYSKQGPYHYKSLGNGIMKLANMSPNSNNAHDHGEADKSIFYWLCRPQALTSPLTTLIKTSDSDIIAMFPHFIPMRKDRMPIIWRDSNGAYINVRRMTNILLYKTKLSPVTWTFFCILNGTDFFERSELFHLIGPDAILKGCQHLNSLITGLWSNCDTKRTDVKMDDTRRTRIALFKKLLVLIYYKYDSKTQNVLEKLDKTEARMNGIKRQRKSPSLPILSGQRTLHGATAIEKLPDWDTVHAKLSVAVRNKEKKYAHDEKMKKRVKRAVAYLKQKRKRGEDLTEYRQYNMVAEETEKSSLYGAITTALRPPGHTKIVESLRTIEFNMAYWMNISGVIKPSPTVLDRAQELNQPW